MYIIYNKRSEVIKFTSFFFHFLNQFLCQLFFCLEMGGCLARLVKVWVLQCLVTLVVEMQTELDSLGELDGRLFSAVDVLLLLDYHHLSLVVHCGCNHSISDLFGNNELHIVFLTQPQLGSHILERYLRVAEVDLPEA